MNRFRRWWHSPYFKFRATRCLADLWRCFWLVWKYRWMQVGMVSNRAEVNLGALECITELRKRHPGRRFAWGDAVNDVIDSYGSYVTLYEVTYDGPKDRDGRTIPRDHFIYFGPLFSLRQAVAEGAFARVIHKDWA